MGNDEQARVTLIVSPRERFGVALRSLESIYTYSDIPFKLIYIDGRLPEGLSHALEEQSKIRGFKHIKLDRYVSPNESRNIGIAEADTQFIVFIDNDIICSEGWLSRMVACADETGADVVAPLVCEGLPLHSQVHQAGGVFSEDAKEFFATKYGERELLDVLYHLGEPLEKVRSSLKRMEVQTSEFHCVLTRRSVFDRIGPLDEKLLATREHMDFCMSVVQSGGKVMFEPTSIVTYLHPSREEPISKEDWPYFLLRWSPIWQAQSLDHFQKKWGLKDGSALKYLRERLHMRHFEGLIQPELRKTPILGHSKLWTRVANRAFRLFLSRKIAALAADYERQKRNALRPQGA